MPRRPERGLFIAGTSTEVGKTFVAALIARSLRAQGHRVGVYKPVASGCRTNRAVLVSDDAVRLAEAADCLDDLEDVCPQRFAAPLAPYIAARAEGKQIDEDLLLQGIEVWSDRCDIVLVEGAGGLMSPITDQVYNATLAGELGYPLVIVAPNELGVINQALQTLITAKAVGEDLPVAAVILNNLHEATDPSCQSNLRELKSHCSPVSVYEVARDATELSGVTDWYALAGSC